MVLKDGVNTIDWNLRPLFARLRIRTAEDEFDHLPTDPSHEIFGELTEFGQCIIGKRLVRVDLLNSVSIELSWEERWESCASFRSKGGGLF
jgi:hypothetical protein